jgi:hypothetical protein
MNIYIFIAEVSKMYNNVMIANQRQSSNWNQMACVENGLQVQYIQYSKDCI